MCSFQSNFKTILHVWCMKESGKSLEPYKSSNLESQDNDDDWYSHDNDNCDDRRSSSGDKYDRYNKNKERERERKRERERRGD